MRINLTKKDIIKSIYLQIGLSKKIIDLFLEDIIKILTNSIKENKKVKISKFGTFIVRNKKKRIGRNPKTNEESNVSERNVLLFKPSKELKKYINNHD
tara:strand:- start:139 stop:432 length:294 start_codon:yes stop_codon:yes gene_type:complete